MQTAVPATRYKPYTQEDDDRLVVYLATHNVRTGSSTPYKSIVLNEDGTSPWGAERTWAGWRSRYAHHKQSFDRKIEVYRRKHGIVVQSEPQPEPDLLLTMSNASLTKTPGPNGFSSPQNFHSASASPSSPTQNNAKTAAPQISNDTARRGPQLSSIVDKVIGANSSKTSHSRGDAFNSNGSPISPASPSSQPRNRRLPKSSGGLYSYPQATSLNRGSSTTNPSSDLEASNDMSALIETASTSTTPQALPARMARKRKHVLDHAPDSDGPGSPEHSGRVQDMFPSPNKSARMDKSDIERPLPKDPLPFRSGSGMSPDSYPPRSPSPTSLASTPVSLPANGESSQMSDEDDVQPSDYMAKVVPEEDVVSFGPESNTPIEISASNVVPVEADDQEDIGEDIDSEYEAEPRKSNAALSASGVGWGGLGHLLGL